MQQRKYVERGLASVISVDNGSGSRSLRIRLPRSLYEGKTKFLSLGMSDTAANRLLAERKCQGINGDIINGQFDPTLERYKPKKQIAVIQPASKEAIDTLYEEYINDRRESCSKNTYKKNYLEWLKRFQKAPSSAREISDNGAQALMEWHKSQYSTDATRRFLVQAAACCDWAVKLGKAKANPYVKVRDAVPVPKKKRKTPKAFTREEIKHIIEAFSGDRYYSYYTNYVRFLFATGARPSEVVALTWQDIDDRFVHFSKRVIESTEGKICDEGLKSQEARKFPINKQIAEILDEQRGKSVNLVFPSPRNKYIDHHNFRNRAWAIVMKKLEIQYHKPYTSRASFITHTLEHLDAKDVGKVCGNKPESIYRHYASSNYSSLVIPEAY